MVRRMAIGSGNRFKCSAALTCERGYTYIGLLFVIAIMGILAAATGTSWHAAEQRAKEKELLAIGAEYRRAIGQYYEQSPGAIKQYPRNFHDLLKDDRYLGVKRYLRRVYADPMTQRTQWGIVYAPTGGMMGVYSLSAREPFKKFGFRIGEQGFEHAATYSDWLFVYEPPANAQRR